MLRCFSRINNVLNKIGKNVLNSKMMTVKLKSQFKLLNSLQQNKTELFGNEINYFRNQINSRSFAINEVLKLILFLPSIPRFIICFIFCFSK
jgi:hypothetical protein